MRVQDYTTKKWEPAVINQKLSQPRSYMPGLDIGYVPAGPHAFFRSSGQFGPQPFILCWPAGPVAFRSVANACTSFSVDVSPYVVN